jgi:two-component system response regulator FixJ
VDQAAPHAPRQTIVLVEDDRSLLGAMTFALQAEGFHVRAYADGRVLLAAPPAEPVNCLVVDFRLPGVDGLELIASLRALGTTAPAILITTEPDERCRREATKAGVPIVEKPLLDGELRRRIDEALARGSS